MQARLTNIRLAASCLSKNQWTFNVRIPLHTIAPWLLEAPSIMFLLLMDREYPKLCARRRMLRRRICGGVQPSTGNRQSYSSFWSWDELSMRASLHDHQNILPLTVMPPTRQMLLPRLCATSSLKPLLEAMPPKRPPIVPEYLITRNHFYFDGSPTLSIIMVRILRLMAGSSCEGCLPPVQNWHFLLVHLNCRSRWSVFCQIFDGGVHAYDRSEIQAKIKQKQNVVATSGRQFLESKGLIFKSKWPWIKKIIFWYGIWDSPQICEFVSNLPIEIKSQKSKSSLRFAFMFVMRMPWLAMSQLCSVTQSLDNGLDCLGQWLASNNGLVPVNRWV
jgi:hypothetical protein